MASAKSFMLYFDNKNQFDIMTDAQAGELIKALFAFAESGEIPEFSDGMVKMAFSFISAQIIRDTRKYEDMCAKRAENIKKRWEKNHPNANDTSVYNCINSNTKNTNGYYTDKDTEKETDIDTDTDKETDTDIIINNNKQKSPTKSEIEKEFELIWNEYPKKECKKKSFSCYERARKKGTGFETVLEGVKAYAKSCVNKEYRYIKQGGTYFSNECWNDVLGSAPSEEHQQSYDIESFDNLAVNLRKDSG